MVVSRFGGGNVLLVSLVAALSSPAAVLAQSGTSVIAGIVKDATGASIPGATVLVSNIDTGVAATTVTNLDGAYHAGALVPRKLNSLGVSTENLRRHIAWDIGAAAVAVKLAARLAAFLILQTYSRLVIDCNCPPGSAESFVRLSETTRIPGNASVSAVDALAREREVFRQYQERIRTELDVRKAQHRRTILIAMHRFTPWFHGHQGP